MNKFIQKYVVPGLLMVLFLPLYGQELELINSYEADGELGISMRFTDNVTFIEDATYSPPQLRIIVPNTSYPKKRYQKDIDLPPLYRYTVQDMRGITNKVEIILYFTSLPEYTIELDQERIIRISWLPQKEEVARKVRAQRISSMESTVSLNFKDAQLIDVLRLLQTQNNLNIIAGEEVKGKVTVGLNDVNLGTALDAILKVNGFDWFMQENILVIKKIETEMEGSTETRIYKLEYVDASAVASAITNVLTKKGKIQVFSATQQNPLSATTSSGQAGGGTAGVLGGAGSAQGAGNAAAAGLTGLLGGIATGGGGAQGSAPTTGGGIAGTGQTNADHILVTDVHYNFDKIEDMIYTLDQPVKQINISVKFIETRLTMDERMGINWSARTQLSVPGSPQTATGGTATGATGALGGTTTQTATASASTLLELGQWRQGLKVATLSLPVFHALLEVFSNDGSTRLLQEPQVTAKNNSMATVNVGTTIPILVPQAEGGTFGSQPYQFQDEEVSVTLNVFPRINEDRFVSMSIDAQIEAITGFTGPNNDRPIISNRQTTTQITVRDGETLLIGGLIYDQYVETHTITPILGKIPFIKHFFRHTITTSEQTELLIFITPHIVKLS